MKNHRVATLVLVFSLAMLPLAAWGQHDHGKAAGSDKKSTAMMGDHEAVQKLLDDAAAALDEAANSADPAQQKAALARGQAKLAEFRQLFDKHHADMAEHMKSCPMMKGKSHHGSHSSH